mmetsp:Transcript_27473/g.35794  ORF Transcript_27473/g.35794 Transcript_27473/m.35794 type:complete len:132 (-) Transcript_27473:102-497(-)
MNALKPTISRLIRCNVAKRWYNPAPKALRADIGYSIKHYGLSDPSTYPLILVLGCAMAFVTGMGIFSLTTYKDVELDPHKRNSTMRTWGRDEVPTLTERLIYWNSWQKLAPEGLGVDHKKWLEEKQKYMEK